MQKPAQLFSLVSRQGTSGHEDVLRCFDGDQARC